MSRVISLEDAVRVARRRFLATGEVDMRRLAEELAVGRATLYRVVGSRDRLMGTILIEMAETLQQTAMTQAAEQHPSGVEQIVTGAYLMNQQVVGFEPLRTLIDFDPETAFRVLFTDKGGVHDAAVAMWRREIESAAEAGALELPRDAGRLSYMFVRIGESMIFADLLNRRDPDLDMARDLQRALLTLPARPAHPDGQDEHPQDEPPRDEAPSG